MKLELFLIIGYYLFIIYFLRSLYSNNMYSVGHKVFWTLMVTFVPFLGAIVYLLIYQKQYGSPNELRTLIR